MTSGLVADNLAQDPEQLQQPVGEGRQLTGEQRQAHIAAG